MEGSKGRLEKSRPSSVELTSELSTKSFLSMVDISLLSKDVPREINSKVDFPGDEESLSAISSVEEPNKRLDL